MITNDTAALNIIPIAKFSQELDSIEINPGNPAAPNAIAKVFVAAK